MARKIKISKDEARYVDHPVEGRQCDGCTMFQSPKECSLVKGKIRPDGHCRFWEKI